MHWQEELILGGLVKSSQDTLLRCVFINACKDQSTMLQGVLHSSYKFALVIGR